MIRNYRVLRAVALLGMNLIGCGADGSTGPSNGQGAAGSVAFPVAGAESRGETSAGAQGTAGARSGSASGASGAAGASGTAGASAAGASGVAGMSAAAAGSGAGGGSGAAAGSGAGGGSGAAASDTETSEPMPMPKYEPSPNNPAECPAVAPENPVGDCLGLPVYLNCEYGDETYWYVCVCDWYHWLCAGT